MNSCSCLMLIVASIIYWQAKEVSRVINTSDPDSHGIDTSLLPHISPIGWDNVVLYGQYVIDRTLIRYPNPLACKFTPIWSVPVCLRYDQTRFNTTVALCRVVWRGSGSGGRRLGGGVATMTNLRLVRCR